MAPAAGLIVLALLLGAPGAPPSPGGVNVEIVGACPEAAEVRRLLVELLAPDQTRNVPVSIQDLGPRYRVAMSEAALSFYDPARNCAARARQAAVLVADELRPHPPVLGPPDWTIEKGVVFDVTTSSGGTVWVPGAEIRGAYGPGLWSLVGAAGARGPATLVFQNDWKAEVLRFPLDLGARITMHRWKLRPWLTVGGSLTVTGIVGQNLVDTDRVWRLDPGLVVLAGATLPVFGRIGGMAALNFRWQPRPYDLLVSPAGKVGETPTWWIGLSLNYTIDGAPSRP